MLRRTLRFVHAILHVMSSHRLGVYYTRRSVDSRSLQLITTSLRDFGEYFTYFVNQRYYIYSLFCVSDVIQVKNRPLKQKFCKGGCSMKSQEEGQNSCCDSLSCEFGRAHSAKH